MAPQNLREGTAHDSGVLDKGTDVTKYISKCNKILHCKHLYNLKLQLAFPEIKFLYNLSSHFLSICFIRDMIKILAKIYSKTSISKVQMLLSF